jgi:2-oxoglutarate ferredoxin oxidoreductase subunit beta
VEILQNCPIYADGIFDSVKDKKTAADFKLILEHGQPCVFGKEAEKGIHLNRDTLALEVVSSDDADKPLLIHDENNKILANMLATMSNPDFPVAVGVIYQESKASFIEDTQAVLKEARNGTASLQELLLSGHTWEVSS